MMWDFDWWQWFLLGAGWMGLILMIARAIGLDTEDEIRREEAVLREKMKWRQG
jgi:hypothetical protein